MDSLNSKILNNFKRVGVSSKKDAKFSSVVNCKIRSCKKYTTIFLAILQFTAKMYPQKPLAYVERSKLQQFRFTITFLVQENGGRRIKCLSGHK